MAENMSLETVNSMYFDVLKEIGNIGAGNATTALAQLLGTKVDMSVPQVSLLEFKDVGAVVGGEELIMVGILLGVEGDITGSIMFLIEKEGARHLTNKLMMGMGASAEGEDFNEMELSALKEVGNIITGAYLNALSGLTNLVIYPSTPELTVDMAGAILSVPAIQFGIQGDQILLIQNNFFDEVELDGFFILLPDMESYGTILGALGISTL
ncbi:MAG: chemotaxis protein CheC [Lachnospiraceae bacterium]|nr:chemotaxis protein CheC [Lachnospiraceae bacterium]